MSTSPLKQSINLYQKEKGPQIPLSFLQITKILGGFTVFLFLLLVIDGFQYWSDTRQLKRDEQEKSEISQQIKNAEIKIHLTQNKEALAKEAKELELEQKFDIEKIEILKDIHNAESGGFSKFLIALANEVPTEVWLTRFILARNGEYISLEGAANHPPLIPALIDGLGKETAFSGKTFQVFKLEVDNVNNIVNFTLQTAGATKK